METTIPPLPRDLTSKFRRSTPRSRGGCTTCKAKHVKCDEAKPCCTRCHKSNQICQYTISSANSTSVRLRDVSDGIPYEPLVDIPEDYTARRSFHYIQAKNLTQTFGRCEIQLWDTTVLQYSHSDPVVRSSLLALSSIFEIYEAKTLSNDRNAVCLDSLPKQVFSLYTKAVKEVIRCVRMNNRNQQGDRRTVLLSCLIFSWIEVMLSNFDTAQWHLNAGITFVEKLATTPGLNHERKDPEDVYGSLHRSFLRLKYQATVGLAASPMVKQNAVKQSPTAKTTLDQTVTDSELEVTPSSETALTITLHGRHQQIEKLQRVDAAVKVLPSRSVRDEHRRQSLTYLHTKLSRTMLSLMTEPPNKTISGEDSRYTDVVNTVQEIYNRQSPREATVISLDFGVNNPLVFTLQWCKDVKIKRRAFDLLKAGSVREGMWFKEDLIQMVHQQNLLW